MKKVLFTIGSMHVGGAESQVVLLMTQLKELGWPCEIFLIEASGPLIHSLQTSAIPIYDGGLKSGAPKIIQIWQVLRLFYRFMRRIYIFKPDVLHAYLPLTNILGAMAGSLMGVPKIITSRRGLGSHQIKKPYFKLLDRLANRLSHVVTVNSKAVFDDVRQRDNIDLGKLVQVSNGLRFDGIQAAAINRQNMRKALGLAETDFGIIMVANMIPYKGHEDFLRALPSVTNAHPNIKVFFVGSELGRAEGLKQLAESLGVVGVLEFLGRRDDIPDLLAAMDIYVMASHEEGSSNALLEAMAAGLLIVATDVGGNREALDSGRLGLILPARDPEAISGALLKTLSEGKDPLKADAVRVFVKENYSVERMVQIHINLYKSQT